MTLDWAFIAYSALAGPGQLNALGISTDTFTTQRVHGSDRQAAALVFSVVVRVVGDSAEAGSKHEVRVSILDKSGGTQLSADLGFLSGQLNNDVPKGWKVAAQVILPILFAAPEFGVYQLEIRLDASLVKTIPFRILEAPAAQPAS